MPAIKATSSEPSNDCSEKNSESEDEKPGVTLSDIWHMITKHWKGLIVFTVLGVVGASTYAFGFKKPIYQSTGSVIILADSSSSDDSSGINTTNLSLSINLVPSIVSFMNDSPIMQMVTDDINSSKKFSKTYTLTDIEDFVSASARTYTSLEKSLYIDVTANTYDTKLSKALVSDVLTDSITLANDTTQDYSRVFKDTMIISSTASEPDDVSMSNAKILLIGGAVGLAVGVLYGIIFELANTHVTSIKDLESLTGEKVIGLIPDVSLDEKAVRKENKTHEDEDEED